MTSTEQLKVGIADGTKLYQLTRAYCKDNPSSPIVQAVQDWDGLLLTSSITLERVIQSLAKKEKLAEETVRRTAETKLPLLNIQVVSVEVYQTYSYQSNLSLDDDDASILLVAETVKELLPEAEVIIITHDNDFWKEVVFNYLQERGIVLQRAF